MDKLFDILCITLKLKSLRTPEVHLIASIFRLNALLKYTEVEMLEWNEMQTTPWSYNIVEFLAE